MSTAENEHLMGRREFGLFFGSPFCYVVKVLELWQKKVHMLKGESVLARSMRFFPLKFWISTDGLYTREDKKEMFGLYPKAPYDPIVIHYRVVFHRIQI